MKRLLIACAVTFLSLISYSQTTIEQKFHSASLHDTIRCTISLPEKWNINQKYTTLYTFSYGASDARFIAEQIRYLTKLNISNLPPVILVNIWADMDMMGYNYETGLLTDRGMKTMDCLHKEVFPFLEQKYNASKFRTYIGQSYGANYGNYLFLHQPNLFSAYILVSPERIAPGQPPFEITPQLQNFYSQRKTYYFMASGALDMQRRQDYANEVAQKLSKLDSSNFNYQYENLALAGHNNSLAMSLPIALDFIYQQYSSFPEPLSGEKVSSLIKRFENNLDEAYGIGVDKQTSSVYSRLFPMIWQNRDRTGLTEAIDYFITSESDVRQLRDFAYSAAIVGMKDRAQHLYKQAIEKGLAMQGSPDFYPGYLITCYRESADLTEDPKEGWALLQDALQICLRYRNNIYNNQFPNIYYYLGKFSAEKGYNPAEGIKYLHQYIQKIDAIITSNQFPLDKAYYYLGACYSINKDKRNAKLYLQKSLAINPENKKAEDLLKHLK